MGIHGHLIELYQLAAGIAGAACAVVLVFVADKARRVYRATGENKPEVLAAAAANVRDEVFRLMKHVLIVIIGIVTIVMKHTTEPLDERAVIVRWILILISTLMVLQSVMVWRDRVGSERRVGKLHDRRSTDRG